ncbi:MAG: tetratricopeptide repeat protein [Bacteroidota bacterium]
MRLPFTYVALFALCFFSFHAISQPPSVEEIDESRFHFNEGVKFGINNEFENALESFQKAIDKNPLFAQAFLYKGLTEIELAQYEQAIKNLTISIELDPYFSDQAHYFRGLARYYQGNFSEAIDDFSIAIRMNPDYAAFYQRGKANLEMKEYERSLQDFEIALRLKPDFWEAHLYRGINLYYMQQYKDAIKDLELAKENMPENPDAFYYSGLARSKAQNNYVAVEDLTKAIELDPDNKQAYQARAAANQLLGRNEEAEKDILFLDTSKDSVVMVTDHHENQNNTEDTKPKVNDSEIYKTPNTTKPKTSTEINFKELFASANQKDLKKEEKETATDQNIANDSSQTNENKKENQETVDNQTEEETIPDKLSEEENTKPTVINSDVEIVNLKSGLYSTDLSEVNLSGFGVQVASYSNTDNLSNLVKAYNKQYQQPVFINVAIVDGRKLYKLIIGRFDSRTPAENFRDQIRKDNFPDSFLVVFDNL